VIAADPHTVFELLADPRTHARLDGSGMLRGAPGGPGWLTTGDTFTMWMSQAGASYRSTNLIVEYEPDHRRAWQSTGRWRGRKVVGGQRWRYLLHAHLDGTWVEHAYVGLRDPAATDGLAARLHAQDARPAMERTLANLAELAEDIRARGASLPERRGSESRDEY
jgi:hypothetical protein